MVFLTQRMLMANVIISKMQGSREGKVRLSTHTFAGMANALTRKEPPHEDQPELMTRVERRRAARKARAVKAWKKAAAGAVAVATLFGGMGVASTALAADRDSYQDTIGNSSFESARNQYGLAKHMKNGAILHAWMWSFKTITQHMPEIAAAGYTSVQTEPMSKIKEVAANGKKFVNTWMHSGPLRVNGEKMSKSLGNFWTIRDALKETNTQYGDKNGNETLRFFLLRSHYRSPIDFSSALVEDAHQALIRLYTALKNTSADDKPLDWNEKYAAQFKEAMDDDFNTAQAVAVLFELAKEVNQTKSPELARQLKKLGGVLGILQLDPEAFVKGAVDSVDEAAVEALIAERKAAKAAKNWARADEIRKELLEKNIVLEDAPGGVTTWRRA